MSAPIIIVVTPSGSHLADTGTGTTWCGEDVGRWPTFVLEPGSDFGEHPRDCAKCVRERRRAAL